ncbi:MAG: SH3 domain-containing protein [Clostridia bacterium]
MKKRFLALICAVVLLSLTAMPMAALAGAHYSYVYTSNGKTLNMRKAPITHANNKVTDVPYGARVVVHEYVNSATWAYVEYQGRMGYVMTRYLVNQAPAPKPVPKPSAPDTPASFNGFVQAEYSALVRASVPGGYINMRWAPSKQQAIQQRMADGQRVEVIAQNKVWAQVRDDDTGNVGFIMLQFLSVIDGYGAEGAVQQ